VGPHSSNFQAVVVGFTSIMHTSSDVEWFCESWEIVGRVSTQTHGLFHTPKWVSGNKLYRTWVST
jgi:hypothetical protein